jgi:hypothetical protein
MIGKALSPIRLTGTGLRARSAASGVVDRGAACLAARPAGERVTSMMHRLADTSGSSTGSGYSIADRMDEAALSVWFGKDNSTQAGGNDPGP